MNVRFYLSYDIKITLKSHICRKNVSVLSLCTQRCGRHNDSGKICKPLLVDKNPCHAVSTPFINNGIHALLKHGFLTLTTSYQGHRNNPPSVVLELFEKTAGVRNRKGNF